MGKVNVNNPQGFFRALGEKIFNRIFSSYVYPYAILISLNLTQGIVFT